MYTHEARTSENRLQTMEGKVTLSYFMSDLTKFVTVLWFEEAFRDTDSTLKAFRDTRQLNFQDANIKELIMYQLRKLFLIIKVV